MSSPRRPDETFEQYRSRINAEQRTERDYLRYGRVVHQSRIIANLNTQKEVDLANAKNPSGHFKLNDKVMFRNTLRNPPDIKLSKEQRRKLRAILRVKNSKTPHCPELNKDQQKILKEELSFDNTVELIKRNVVVEDKKGE
jgi:hypothetical protein